MKNKTIKIIGMGAVALFLLLALMPITTALNEPSKTSPTRYVKVYVWDDDSQTWRYIATVEKGDCAMPEGIHKIDGHIYKIVGSNKPRGPIA